MITVDIIILSYAHTADLKTTTKNCLKSLIASEDPSIIHFKIIVVESEGSMIPFQYENTRTIYPDESFGYHKYMNIGLEMTSSPFVCMCNNDLIFHQNWATEILKPLLRYKDVHSASPFCSFHHPTEGFRINEGLKRGYLIRREFAGWCVIIKRDILKKMGQLDENYIFWCADNDFANTLWTLKLNHVLVTSSIVDHLENQTLNQQTIARQDELTEQQTSFFYKKWRPRMGENWKLITM